MFPEEAVNNKQLRRDLYYRLNVINFGIPPLRDRKEDIPILADHFIKNLIKNSIIGLPEYRKT